MSKIKIAVWNANGLNQHIHEIKAFIAVQNIDIMLVSETHLTNKSYVTLPNFSIYNTNHPANTARGGSAVLIKNSIAHTVNTKYCTPHIQATSVTLNDCSGKLTVAAIYCPPRHSIKEDQFCHFYRTLGPRFLAAGDYNAKHTIWGSRLISPKGRELFKAMTKLKLSHISSGSPTYWPSDLKKIPDVIDFCVTKGVANHLVNAESCLDLSSDHSPIILTLSNYFESTLRTPFLHNKKTNWFQFRHIVENSINLNIPLRIPEHVETAIEHFNLTVQQAAWNSTPIINSNLKQEVNQEIRTKIQEKRKLRKSWQNTRDPKIKKIFNKASKDLKSMLQEIENTEMANYLQNLSATKSTDYSLWKATKNIYKQTKNSSAIKKNNGDWAKSDAEKAETFATHLSDVFKPFPRNVTLEEERVLLGTQTSNRISSCINQGLVPIRKSEICIAIQKLKLKKSPGYDLITPKVLKELPDNAVTLITFIFNAILRTLKFPSQWKVAEIHMILKPGKPAECAKSYRPISLLPVLSKIMETLLLKRLQPIISHQNLIPDHQFGFRQYHSTTEQVNRVYKIARKALEDGEFCTSVFLDISQAFDKVWHPGLLQKLKRFLPRNFFKILESYLSNRHFFVKEKNESTDIHEIESGVPQGSVLGPILYTLFTSDLPLSPHTYTATFADDTAIMSVNKDPAVASSLLQQSLNAIQIWMKSWRIMANESKSVHITFTLKKTKCPTVSLNNRPVPQAVVVKYLGIHLDQRLTWQTHIFNKRKQLGLKLRSMYWLLAKSSKLSLNNKILIYKTILKPIWTYGIQLWGSAAVSNIAVIERFQSKTLRLITNAPWYITNKQLQHDLQIPSLQDEIKRFSTNYIARLNIHCNPLAQNIANSSDEVRRLLRYHPLDLPTRY